jgi:dTDP-4-dehydrorhamnose reductase
MKEKTKLRVVEAQTGTPTWAFGLATTIWAAPRPKPASTPKTYVGL